MAPTAGETQIKEGMRKRGCSEETLALHKLQSSEGNTPGGEGSGDQMIDLRVPQILNGGAQSLHRIRWSSTQSGPRRMLQKKIQNDTSFRQGHPTMMTPTQDLCQCLWCQPHVWEGHLVIIKVFIRTIYACRVVSYAVCVHRREIPRPQPQIAVFEVI